MCQHLKRVTVVQYESLIPVCTPDLLPLVPLRDSTQEAPTATVLPDTFLKPGFRALPL